MIIGSPQKLTYANPLFLCVADRGYSTPEAEYAFGEHWHEEIEYLIVTSGRLYCTVSGIPLTLNAGEGLLVNSRRIHSSFSPLGEACEYCYVIMHPSCLAASPYIEQKYLSPFLSPDNADYLLLRKDDWTGAIMEDLLRMMDREPEEGFELEILECAYRSFRLMIRNTRPAGEGPRVSSAYDASFKAMLTCIRERYAEKLPLSEIASAGGCGKSLCARLFLRFTSETPGRYLIRYRVARGAELLKTTDRSVTDIAYDVGFTSPSHFTQTFREIMGVTPNRYRHGGKA